MHNPVHYHPHSYTHFHIPAHLICPSGVDWHSPLEEIKCAHAVLAQLDVHLSLKLIWGFSMSTTPTACTYRPPHAHSPVSLYIPDTLLSLLTLERIKLVAAVLPSSHLNQMFIWSLVYWVDFGTTGSVKLGKKKENKHFLLLLKTFCRYVFSSSVSFMLFNCNAERKSLWHLWFQQQQI